MSRNFGDFFKECRKMSKFNGDEGAIELANLLNISRATIYNWEKSEKVPARLHWESVNSVFGKNLEEMFYRPQNDDADKTKMYLNLLNMVIGSMSPSEILTKTNELVMAGEIELAQMFAQLTQKYITSFKDKLPKKPDTPDNKEGESNKRQ